MQRLSNTFLTFALTAFVTAVSLSLMAAAWLMAACLLNGTTRVPLAKWLLMSLLVMTIGHTYAQPAATPSFVVVDDRVLLPNGRVLMLQTVGTTGDTLPPPVQLNYRNPKRRVLPRSPWPVRDRPATREPVVLATTETARPDGFYLLNIALGLPIRKPQTGFWADL